MACASSFAVIAATRPSTSATAGAIVSKGEDDWTEEVITTFATLAIGDSHGSVKSTTRTPCAASLLCEADDVRLPTSIVEHDKDVAAPEINQRVRQVRGRAADEMGPRAELNKMRVEDRGQMPTEAASETENARLAVSDQRDRSGSVGMDTVPTRPPG